MDAPHWLLSRGDSTCSDADDQYVACRNCGEYLPRTLLLREYYPQCCDRDQLFKASKRFRGEAS